MRGPYLLRPLQVDISVPGRVGGVYCLSKSPKSVAVIARTDKNLREAIKSHWNQYEFFWYEPALSPREAYINHCYVFHKHAGNGGLAECEHPTPPEKLDCKCPICGK